MRSLEITWHVYLPIRHFLKRKRELRWHGVSFESKGKSCNNNFVAVADYGLNYGLIVMHKSKTYIDRVLQIKPAFIYGNISDGNVGPKRD